MWLLMKVFPKASINVDKIFRWTFHFSTQYIIFAKDSELIIECEGWRRHSSLIFLIQLFTKPNIEVSGWLYQTKTHFTHIIYQPFSRMSPPLFTLYALTSIFGLVNSSIKKIGLECHLHPSHSMGQLTNERAQFL